MKHQASDSRLKKAEEQFQSAARQYRTAMEPHLDKMETDEGKFYLVLISVIAIAVFKNAESPAMVAMAIEEATARTGIPKDALAAHAHFATEMIAVLEIRHQNRSPR